MGVLGLYLAVALPMATTALSARGPSAFPILVISMATLGLVPISVVIAIARYNLFDVDRLITHTAADTLLGIVLLAGILAAAPRVAQALSGRTGLEASTTQLVLSLVLVAVVVPGHRWLAPRVEALFFAERQALTQGMDSLLRELARCHSPRQLAELTGERLDALLHPESCAIYARDEELFSPIVVRGRVVPPAFRVSEPARAALQERDAVLSAERFARGRRQTQLSPSTAPPSKRSASGRLPVRSRRP